MVTVIDGEHCAQFALVIGHSVLTELFNLMFFAFRSKCKNLPWTKGKITRRAEFYEDMHRTFVHVQRGTKKV